MSQRHGRDHHGGDEHGEQDAAALEVHAGQAVGGERVEEHGDDRDRAGEHDGVEQLAPDRQALEQARVVVERPRARNDLRRPGLRDGVRRERDDHDDDQREDHEERHQCQRDVAQRQADGALGARLLAQTFVFGVDASVFGFLFRGQFHGGCGCGAHAISSFSCLLLVYSWMRPTMSVMMSSTYDSADA